MSITLNESLDAKALAKAYKEKNRLQISNFLDAASAEKLYEIITTKTLWQITYNEGEKIHWIDPKTLESRVGRRIREMTNSIMDNAAKGDFQYIRFARPLAENQTDMPPLDQNLVDAYDFLNGKAVAGFIKSVTGKAIKEADAEAQWFQNDNFQTKGDGTAGDGKRLIGFCLSLAKDWDAGWGGNTFFYDGDGNIEDVYTPAFNSLEIFEIPTSHSINLVAPYTPNYRVSITGAFLG